MKRFDRTTGVADAIREIGVDRLTEAIGIVADDEVPRAEAVHRVRRLIKTLRALVRVTRSSFDGYKRENLFLRDTGRLLAHQRDTDVMRETYDAIVERAGLKPDPGLRERLGRTAQPADMPGSAEALSEAGCRLKEMRRRVPGWRFDESGFDLIAGGIKRVYGDMRRAQAEAHRHPSAAALHEWRKQVKHHIAHIGLLRDSAPEILKAYRGVAKDLADILGEHHDLDVLATSLEVLDPLPRGQRDTLIGAIRHRDQSLEREAFRMGAELVAEKPSDFLERLHHNWRDWRG